MAIKLRNWPGIRKEFCDRLAADDVDVAQVSEDTAGTFNVEAPINLHSVPCPVSGGYRAGAAAGRAGRVCRTLQR